MNGNSPTMTLFTHCDRCDIALDEAIRGFSAPLCEDCDAKELRYFEQEQFHYMQSLRVAEGETEYGPDAPESEADFDLDALLDADDEETDQDDETDFSDLITDENEFPDFANENDEQELTFDAA